MSIYFVFINSDLFCQTAGPSMSQIQLYLSSYTYKCFSSKGAFTYEIKSKHISY